LLVCSGTYEQAAYEDALGAGALCDLIWEHHSSGVVSDSATMARRLFHFAKDDLPGAIALSRNGRRLLGRPDLRDDVAFCSQLNIFNLVAAMESDGLIRVVSQ